MNGINELCGGVSAGFTERRWLGEGLWRGGLLIKVSSTQHGEGVKPAAAGGDTTHSRGPPRGEGGRGGAGWGGCSEFIQHHPLNLLTPV